MERTECNFVALITYPKSGIMASSTQSNDKEVTESKKCFSSWYEILLEEIHDRVLLCKIFKAESFKEGIYWKSWSSFLCACMVSCFCHWKSLVEEHCLVIWLEKPSNILGLGWFLPNSSSGKPLLPCWDPSFSANSRASAYRASFHKRRWTSVSVISLDLRKCFIPLQSALASNALASTS